jgi:hypothetical protein
MMNDHYRGELMEKLRGYCLSMMNCAMQKDKIVRKLKSWQNADILQRYQQDYQGDGPQSACQSPREHKRAEAKDEPFDEEQPQAQYPQQRPPQRICGDQGVTVSFGWQSGFGLACFVVPSRYVP